MFRSAEIVFFVGKKRWRTGIHEKGSAFFLGSFVARAIPTLSSITILLSLQLVSKEVAVNKVLDLFNTIIVALSSPPAVLMAAIFQEGGTVMWIRQRG